MKVKIQENKKDYTIEYIVQPKQELNIKECIVLQLLRIDYFIYSLYYLSLPNLYYRKFILSIITKFILSVITKFDIK